jgi:small subunit ribosomal protein S6
MREYETIVLLKPDVGDAPLNEMAQRIKQIVDGDGGKFLQMTSWGKKKLAYEINKVGKAVFLHASYLGASGTPKELERNLRISEDVVRYLTVQLADLVDPTTREAKELETIKVLAEMEDEDPFRPRRDDAESEFGGDDFEGGFEEEENN